eukprot:5107599-Pyramimonas_sp.AAC.1
MGRLSRTKKATEANTTTKSNKMTTTSVDHSTEYTANIRQHMDRKKATNNETKHGHAQIVMNTKTSKNTAKNRTD